MRHIPYPDHQSALARSAQWATHLGCGTQPEDVTRYWYGVRDRTGDVDADAGLPAGVAHALVVAEPSVAARLIREDQMTAAEIAALVELYPAYAVGAAYTVGDLCAHAGHLYQVIQAHTSQASWVPATTPALYLRRTPPDVIPEWRQPTGGHDAYAKGARVTYQGKVWESTVNANVWAPGVFGWIVVA